MSNLRAFVLNSTIGGETFTHEGEKSIRDTVTFTCDGQKFVMRTKSTQEANVLVENVPPTQKDAILEAVERICWLLSFATQSQVASYGHDYPDGSGPSLRTSINRAGQNTDSVIEPADGAAIREFVDQTYPAFKALENARSLRVAIDYMLQAARPGLPMECKLVFMFVLLENMKQTYGMQQQYTFKGGKFIDPVTKAQIGFKDMMILMFGAVGMAPNLQALVGLRNEVIHTGVATLTHPQQKLQYDAANDLIREYLLRLLGFKGTFFVSAKGGTVKTI